MGGYLRTVSVLALLGSLVPAGAATALPPGVAAALNRIDRGQAALARVWSYRKLLVTATGSVVFAYDPRRDPGERWRVVEVNGKPPKAAERKRLAREAETAAKAGAVPVSAAASDWLHRSRYRLVNQTPRRLIYRITLRVGTRENAATRSLLRHLSGRLVITRADYWPVELVLSNSAPFSPRFGVRITGFIFKVSFDRLTPTGPVVVVKTRTEARGKVFWVKSFDDKVRVVLSDFRPVTPADGLPPTATGHGAPQALPRPPRSPTAAIYSSAPPG